MFKRNNHYDFHSQVLEEYIKKVSRTRTRGFNVPQNVRRVFDESPEYGKTFFKLIKSPGPIVHQPTARTSSILLVIVFLISRNEISRKNQSIDLYRFSRCRCFFDRLVNKYSVATVSLSSRVHSSTLSDLRKC